jgi:hypothetical protein
VTEVKEFGLEGSGGSSPLRMTLEDGSRVFGKIYSTSHERADRWYRFGRTILYGQLEDETAIGSVRRLAAYEDYALRLLADHGVRVARTYGLVELTPNQEYMLVTEFFENARNLGDSEIDDTVIDEGLGMVRTFWDIGVAHRDIKPANLLVRGGHLQLVDVSALEVRPSPWRQAVDLSNMLLVLALRTDPERVYARATKVFTPDEIAEAGASAVGLTIPTELQAKLKADGRPLLKRFRELAPAHEPVSIQRWSTSASSSPPPRPSASWSWSACSSIPSAPASANDKTKERVGRRLSLDITSLKSGPTPGRTAAQLGLRVHRWALPAPPRPLAAGASPGTPSGARTCRAVAH